MMQQDDPYLVAPELLYGVLCEEIQVDDRKRVSLIRTFNNLRLFRPPPESSVPPHAHFRYMVVFALGHGIGSFSGDLSLHNAADDEVWRNPEAPFEFTLAPGGTDRAIVGGQYDIWIREPGLYYFRLRLREVPKEWPVRFLVSERLPNAPEDVKEPDPVLRTVHV